MADYTGYYDSPDYDTSMRDVLANMVRSFKKPENWQAVQQGMQNVANVAPSVAESLARGGIAQVPGTFGDVSQLARTVAPQTMNQVFGQRSLPTTEEILAKVPRYTPNYEGSQQHEMVGEVTGPALAKMLKMGVEATKGMPVGNMIAYHGTPHDIQGGFDISKVGTGEGAQAYGHGMYFAENPNVAKEYQKIVQGPESTAQHYLQMYKTPESAIAVLEGSLKPNLTPEAKKFTEDAINVLKSGKELKGNLYKVDIPDEHIPYMLDWDKLLSQQTPEVQAALKKHENFNTQRVLDGRLKTRENLVKEGKDTTNIDKQIQVLREEIADPYLPETTGEKYYSMYANRFNNMKDTSDYLHSLGIKGIRYLDAGSRNPGFSSLTPTQLEARIESLQADIKSGSGNTQKMKDQLKGLQNELDSYKNMTSNFVVFDPSSVKILEKNNKPVRDLLEEQFNKIEK